VIVYRLLKGVGAALSASIFVLAACAPLPQDTGPAAAAAASGAQANATAGSLKPAPRAAAPQNGPQGEQRIVVGAAGGHQTTLTLTPPSQVCDADAFADGVRYGYAYTWNRLVLEQMREGGAKGAAKAAATPKFDPATIHLQDDQYAIQWNGNERVNACASDGYLIGRIVGTHRASVDMRGGSAS
jgi:hypothetical protein